jgi:cyclopropane fatty-acyl-phospholipid synthase-like methyltransferase
MIVSMIVERDWRSVFEQTYSGPPSLVAERVWRGMFGDEYPMGVDPFSYISRSELDRFATEVQVGKEDTLADLGCGRGGPGLWVAMATGARLIGVDIAENALQAARERAQAMGLERRAQFQQGSFDNTGLAAGSVDAVMSIDALLFAPDKHAALAELRQILRVGGRLVFTSWDYHSQPKGRPPQVDDHRPLLAAAGFEVLAYEETTEWRRRVTETDAGLLENLEELAAEIGEPLNEVRAQHLEMHATIEAMRRRVLAVAQAR